MNKPSIRATLLTLACIVVSTTHSFAKDNQPSGALRFHTKTVAGTTMVSSGYPSGSMTFSNGGTLTCNNYPKEVTCLTWKVESDGKLHREFLDTRSVPAFKVQAVWTLKSKNGNLLQVDQTSNNSPAVTPLTVTIK